MSICHGDSWQVDGGRRLHNGRFRLESLSRMLKNSASFVLASFRPSTGTRLPHHSAARTDVVLLIRRTERPRGYASGLHLLWPCLRNGTSWRDGVGGGEKFEFFEHPSGAFYCCPTRSNYRRSRTPTLCFYSPLRIWL